MKALLLLSALAMGQGSAVPGQAAKEIKTIPVGPNVRVELEGKQRRVLVQAKVVLTKGPLEGLLTRSGKKEHEYILAGDFDARHLHAALELAGAKAGKPVQFRPKYIPASGSLVRIRLRYNQDDKPVEISAREWIVETKTGKPLASDWVFGGSKLVPHPEGPGKPDYYVANYGDVVCLCNMDSALLDLPIASPKKFDERIYEANSKKIPKEGTTVTLIFEVVPEKDKPRGGRRSPSK
jgi:hypothetical protein